MTTGPAINTDTRIVAAGLVANLSVIRPYLITATGRAAPSRLALTPPGPWVPFGLLPHTDYIDDPEHRPGCGFVGGRISSFVPFLASGSIPTPANIVVTLRTLPQNGEDILRDLRSRAGLWSAPGALFARAAWTDAFVATWLEGLRENGDGGQLIIAHAQAALATRKMWLAVEWDVGVSRHSPLAIASGAVAVGRALVDVIALVDRLASPERAGFTRPAHRETALAALLTAFHHFLRHTRAAEETADLAIAKSRLKRAVGWARRILDATGVFAVADDDERKRWTRLTNMLDLRELRDHAGGAAVKLDRLSYQLERLGCADLGHRLERTSWRPHIRRSLLRLVTRDRRARLALLARIRCDLIFALAATRALERLYQLFPWLGAPHGAFPGCAGGALGALASLYEAARGVEIGHDMKRRLGDAGQQPGMVSRLTVRQTDRVFALPRQLVLAAGHSYAAGAALVAQVTSHVMLKAALKGRHFGDRLSLDVTRWGNLGYNDAAAYKMKRARDAVLAVQQSQPVFQVNSRDDDLVRHMGLTLVRHFGAAARSIWPTANQRSDFVIHRLAVHTGDRPHQSKADASYPKGPWDALSKVRVHHELVGSMLKTVDGEDKVDHQLRDAILDMVVLQAGTGEHGRAARRREAASRKKGAWTDHEEGQSAARRAGDEPTVSGDRGSLLRALVEDAGRWREVHPKKPASAPQDDMLEDILLGRANLAQLAPVSDLFIPILWFAPLIDQDRLAWIARGMPGQLAGGDDAPRAARIKSWIAAVRRWSCAPSAGPIVRGREDVIACHLFTGVSSVTADWGHVQ